jgi:DNA-binding response OmpR family regulator
MPPLLIVEDEANIRRFVAANLSARGYSVIEAGDAEEGLKILREQSPGVLILDIRLPGMSGWDLLEEMARDTSLAQVPVIVMTASVTNVKFGETSYTNVVQWLVKPVSVHELIHAVKKAANHAGASSAHD